MSEKKNPWLPLFLTNFLSVLNDNVIKYLVIFIGVTWISVEYQPYVVPIASALLVIPFILFSPLAGRFAKIYEKKKIMIWGKFAEIPIMLVAIVGFIFQSLPIVMTAVLLMGLQSTMFSPAKYGLIRDIRGKEGISFGTGMMEMLTFVGVLLGTVLSGQLANYLKEDYNIAMLSAVLLSVAVIGWVMAKLIKADESPVIESKNDTLNPVLFIWKQYRIAKHYPGVNNAIFGLSLFWLIGATIQYDITDHARYIFGMDDLNTGIIMSIAAIGIAVGAILTGWLSGKRVHLGYVIVGSLGLGISMFLIMLMNPAKELFIALIFIGAFFAGFFKIPLNSYVQDAVQGRKLGDILGYLNVMVFVFILFSAGIYAIFNYMTAETVQMKERKENRIVMLSDTLVLANQFQKGDALNFENTYIFYKEDRPVFGEDKITVDTVLFSYSYKIDQQYNKGDTLIYNHLSMGEATNDSKDTLWVGKTFVINNTEKNNAQFIVSSNKLVVDTLLVFGFIGLISLLTGIFFFFKVDGAKEDFLNILKGKLGRS